MTNASILSRLAIAWLPVCLVTAVSGPRSSHPYEFTEVHMGLPVRLVLHATDATRARRAAQAAFVRIAALDRMLSDYRPDSALSRLADRPHVAIPLGPDLFAVLNRSIEIARATRGAFDPTIAPLVALWRSARAQGRLPDPRTIESARGRVGWERIVLDPVRQTIRQSAAGMRFDLGGIAKGYILQEALATLRRSGVTTALIEAGGDIVVGEAPPERPGWHIEADGATAEFRRRAGALTNAALATSGATAQFVEIDGVRYSHVIDPRTGLGLTNRVLARVIHQDAATADGLATALTVVGAEGAAPLLARFPGALASVVSPN